MAKILYIEDTENNRILVLRFLQKKGYEVWTAEEAEEGIALAQSIQPDIILMDMGLPGVDGWEATRRLKSDPQTRHIPVLALTAHVMEGDREKALAVGCDDYDTKPFQFPRLLSKVETLLARPGETTPPREAGRETRTDFLAQARHDLRNPLAHIIGFAELLSDKGGAENKAREHDLEAIREQAQRMVELINRRLKTENFRECEGKALEAELEGGAALIAALARKWASSQEPTLGHDFRHIQEAADDLSRLTRIVLREVESSSLRIQEQGREHQES